MDLQQRKLWNENHKKLTGMIQKQAEHEQAVALFLNQHALLYSSKMESSQFETLEDELLQDITEETLRNYPNKATDTKNSIVWHLWHITRIEDMTMNVLTGNREQVFHTGAWEDKLHTRFVSTGNEMSEQEMAEFSAEINIDALLAYRLKVGQTTREVIRSLEPGGFKQKVDPAKLKVLSDHGSVKPEAGWLLEYWGSKTIGGLVLMPATRHNYLHLNKSIRIKQKLQSKGR